MSRRRVMVKQQKPQGGGMQAAMKEVRVLLGILCDDSERRNERQVVQPHACLGSILLSVLCVFVFFLWLDCRKAV